MHVQYGCGLSAPKEWINFDVSPTLRLQNTPIIGRIFSTKLNTVFPDNVKYGNIIEGLPIPANSCDGVFCSHTLEHLALVDLRKALINTRAMLKEGGRFRCIVPDLEAYARKYVAALDKKDAQGSHRFLKEALLGVQQRDRGLKALATFTLGNANHLWMWDQYSLTAELEEAGFKNIRTCSVYDSEDKMFNLVEEESRFVDAICLEAIK